jgi:hypothetical protein
MQPMGRPNHVHKVPCFFPFKFGGAGRGFFSFFPGSHCVLTMFPLSFQWVPNMFPNMFSIAPPFYPICFGKCCPPFTYIAGTKDRNSILQNRTIYFGEPLSFF